MFYAIIPEWWNEIRAKKECRLAALTIQRILSQYHEAWFTDVSFTVSYWRCANRNNLQIYFFFSGWALFSFECLWFEQHDAGEYVSTTRSSLISIQLSIISATYLHEGPQMKNLQIQIVFAKGAKASLMMFFIDFGMAHSLIYYGKVFTPAFLWNHTFPSALNIYLFIVYSFVMGKKVLFQFILNDCFMKCKFEHETRVSSCSLSTTSVFCRLKCCCGTELSAISFREGWSGVIYAKGGIQVSTKAPFQNICRIRVHLSSKKLQLVICICRIGNFPCKNKNSKQPQVFFLDICGCQ